jgi:hypothetical protein
LTITRDFLIKLLALLKPRILQGELGAQSADLFIAIQSWCTIVRNIGVFLIEFLLEDNVARKTRLVLDSSAFFLPSLNCPTERSS